MRVLGLSAFYHDSAAAIVEDGGRVAAQEERFTRRRRDPGFSTQALRYCLDTADGATGFDRIVFYEKPFLKFERLIETYLAFAPRGFGSLRRVMPLWIGEKLFQKDLLIKAIRAVDPRLADRDKLRFAEHHHAASVFYPSPFKDAVVLTMDGVGVGDDLDGGRARRHADHREGDPLPALARAAVLRLHLLHRLRGQFRRVLR